MEQPENATLAYTEEELAAAYAGINASIGMGEALARLAKNKDFKKVITESYLEQGAINLVRNFSKVDVETKQGFVKQIEARSELWRHIDRVEEEALSAAQALAEVQE